MTSDWSQHLSVRIAKGQAERFGWVLAIVARLGNELVGSRQQPVGIWLVRAR